MPDAVFEGALWTATAPAAPATHALAGDITADVVIIGGGYTGLSCALAVAQGGASAVVLEADVIGYGASGRNNGQVIPTLSRMDPDDVPPRIAPEAGGAEKGEQLVQLVADSAKFTFELIRRHAIDCEAVQNGWVQPVHTPGRMRLAEKRVKAWARRGAPVELLDARGVEAITGSKFWHGGWENATGGKLNPLAYVRGLAKVALAAGASVYTQSPVHSVERVAGGWKVSTAHGSVRADKVVIATQAYGDTFSSSLWPKLMQTVFPVRSHQMATQVYPEAVRATVLPEDHACSDSQGDLHFFRWDAHGRLVTGAALAVPLGWRERAPARAAERVEKVFPQLGRPKFEYVWHGNVGITWDKLPHCHELAPGVLAFVGCNGRGVALATSIGAQLARATLGVRVADLPMPFTALDPFPAHGIARRFTSFPILLYRRRDAAEIN
ncbi:MAG: FAD-binding oxidoreductase [Betaproteobacteria bacterium]